MNAVARLLTGKLKMCLSISIVLLLFGITSLSAQIFEPVKWEFSSKHIQDNEYELVFTAKIDKGWYLYSQFLEEGGPVPTAFDFQNTKGVKRKGSVKEDRKNRKTIFDDIFGMTVTKFSKKAVFRQRVRLEGDKKVVVKGGVDFMTCNNERCLPPDYKEFDILISPRKVGPKTITKQKKPAVTQTKPTKPRPTTTTRPVEIKPTIGTIGKADGEFGANSIPVKWQVEGIRINKDEYEVTFKAKIKEGWELYSQYGKGKEGPMPTSFEFDNRDERIEIARKAKEEGENRLRSNDNRFGLNLTRYQDEVSFTQKIKITEGSRKVNGNIYFVAANNDTYIPPYRVPFAITLPSKITPTEAELRKQERERAKAEQEAVANAEESVEEEEETAATDEAVAQGGVGTPEQATATEQTRYTGDKFNYEYAMSDCVSETEESKSLWLIFLLGLGGGFLALLTPCVFPMIPITVSYFTKSSKSKAAGVSNAIIYGLSIIGIYVTLGLAVTGIFGAEALNQMASSAFFNLLFFAVFVLFAISFFGYFELTLPSSWANNADQAADRGGLLGIFFMAFTLAIVSFSCTGPLIGTLLVETARDASDALLGWIPTRPLVGMLGFSVALALPFALFAAFPGWLNSLPQSGSWMTTVKVTLGFLELALALKFLSTADLVYDWGILRIELFLGLWIIIFLGLAAYMFGFIKFPHDAPLRSLSRGRFVTGLASIGIVLYLVQGFNYKPLSLLSGLAPPSHYNFFQDKSQEEYPDCPNGIRCFKDYDEGLAYAKEENLPLLIDFTGHACVNCRKVEENVWSVPEVKEILSKDYVLVSLYVDDREKLENPYRNDQGKLIRTVGNKWTQFQIDHFNQNSQPLYVLIDNEEKVLHKPIDYTIAQYPDKYIEFLECGLSRID